MRNTHSTIVALTLAGLGLAGCSSNDGERPPPAAERARLTSQFQVHFPGLDEVVTHVFYADPSGFLHKRVLRADGRAVPLAELVEAERFAYAERFGKMTYALATRVAVSEPHEVLHVGVVYDPRADEGALGEIGRQLVDEENERLEALRSGRLMVDTAGSLREVVPDARPLVERWRARAALEEARRELLSAAVRREGAALAAALSARGYLVDDASSSTTPLLSVWVRAADVSALAAARGVSWLLAASGGAGEELAAPYGMSFHKIDTQMNASPIGLSGTNQKVGLLENVKCAVHDKHEAFSATTPVYSTAVAAQNCSSDADCSSLCKTLSGDDPGICTEIQSSGAQKKCVDPHLSQVASGVWGTKAGTGYGAYRATPYVWLGSSSSATNTACQPTETRAAFDWLNTNGVKTVVASYGCDSNSDDGFVEDWNAARRDVAIFRAAPPGDVANLTTKGCRPANALCVGGMTTQNNAIDAWRNPKDTSGFYYLDREEPDLVAFAGDSDGQGVEVMRVPTTSDWVQAQGTSFASPLIAGMGALMKEKCGGSLDQRYLRALLMVSAWYYDPEDSSEGGLAFSTQPKFDEPGSMTNPGFINDQAPNTYGNDYKDGAGGPIGGDALIGCGTDGGRFTFDGGPLTLSSSGGSSFTLPEGSGSGYNITLPGEGGPSEPVVVLSYDATNLKTAWSRVYRLADDTRLRAVLVWDKCTPTAASGPGSGPYNFQNPTDDYDLVLCPEGGKSCAALSRSVYDNKEGFDVRIATGGDYRLSILYDADASLGCNGSHSVGGAFAVIYSSPASNFVEGP